MNPTENSPQRSHPSNGLARLPWEASVADAAAALADGGLVVVTDAADRENEADLLVAASLITERQTAFMIRNTSGILCAPMRGEEADRLRLDPMTDENTDVHGTAFTVSVDHVSTGTGVSARDRTATFRRLADATARPEEFRRPGHVFPLSARPGGVLKRAGHTEAAVDLLELAGLPPVGVISELAANDGHMLTGREAVAFAEEHDLPILTIESLVRHQRARRRLVTPTGRAGLPTRFGDFDAFAYLDPEGHEHLALVLGDLQSPPADGVLVRVHSECLTGDLFGSLRCDCGSQLKASLGMIAEAGVGVVVYLRGHEGRGIGLGHKLRAYALQEQGHDTVDANIELGLPIDDRDYGVGAQILADLGVRRIRLVTNNPAKYSGLAGHDLEITSRVSLPPTITVENLDYLVTKRDRMDHDIRLSERRSG